MHLDHTNQHYATYAFCCVISTTIQGVNIDSFIRLFQFTLQQSIRREKYIFLCERWCVRACVRARARVCVILCVNVSMCVGQSKYLKNENNCKAVFLVYAVPKGISLRASEGASALLGHGVSSKSQVRQR